VAICLRCRSGRDAGWLREFDRPRGIADFVIVKVYYVQSLAVFNFTFAKIVKIWLPLIVLFKIFAGVFRNQDMAGVAAIHHALGSVNSGAGNISLLV
jgi:hypothetical protein